VALVVDRFQQCCGGSRESHEVDGFDVVGSQYVGDLRGDIGACVTNTGKMGDEGLT
jgi:hypothetical protein